MRIDGLNHKQVKMLDTIWNFESFEQYVSWKRTLSVSDQMQCDILIELLMIAEADEQVEKMESFPMVEELIKDIQKNT